MKLTGKLAEKGIHAFDGEPRVRDGRKMPRLWCVVADREKAHIFRKTEEGIECIADARIHMDAGGAKSHGHDRHTAKRQHGDTSFIRKLTGWLDEAAQKDVFDELILIAAPRALGDMRSMLGKHAQERVKAEVSENLAHLPANQIEERLYETAWF